MADNSVLISGVSSGIGLATAERLLAAGYRVFGLSRTTPSRGDIVWREADVGNWHKVAAAVAGLPIDNNSLDAVICNAGGGLIGPVEDVPDEAARQLFATNYFGTVNLIRATLPRLRQQRHGRIIIVGSLAGRVPLPFQAHYSASKSAVESLAFALSEEVASFDLKVSLVEPGDVRTGFLVACPVERVENTAYAAMLGRCIDQIQTDMDTAPDIRTVVDAIERAIKDPRPRLRYPVGRGAIKVAVARRVLPEAFNQFVVRKHFRIDG